MKKLSTVLLLFVGLYGIAQSVNQTIEKQYKAYNQLIIDGKIDDALNYTNPDMFNIVPRQQMAGTMKAIFANPQTDLKSLMPAVSHFEPVKKIDGKNYVRFKSHTTVEMRYKPDPKEIKTAEDELINREMMQAALEQKYGKENINYDAKTGIFRLRTTKTVVASSDDLKSWKFIVIDNPQVKTTLATFIPAELLE